MINRVDGRFFEYVVSWADAALQCGWLFDETSQIAIEV